MIAVAFETSGRPSSVALSKNGELLEEVLTGDRAHASDLLPALERLMNKANTAKDAIDMVFVGTGPGSYTGLRVGIATALGLARGTGAKLLGIPSGESRTFSECEAETEATLLLDARQSELYFARYRRSATDVIVLDEPRVTTSAELPTLLPSEGVILGDSNVAKAAELSEQDTLRVRIANELGGYPRAAALLELGLARLESGAVLTDEVPEPLYLRPFASKPRAK